jgi:translation initiation factor 3 subunit F
MKGRSLLLPTLGTNLSVKIHPVALFSICDGYIRRNEKQDRVIGTLLGVVSDGTVEIKNCYIVPHNESSEQVAVDIAHHRTMFELHQRVAPSETVVGWFATGPALYNSDALIQEFYTKEAPNSVHLQVDTTLSGGKFSIHAFMSRILSVGEKVLSTEFVEMPCEVLFGDAERVGVELLAGGGASTKPLTDNESLATSLKRLEELLDKVHCYVDDVIEGRAKGDPVIGRYLADTLSVVPHFSKPDFERLFNESTQDVMMVTYLSNLLRTQIALADKLGTSQLPIV